MSQWLGNLLKIDEQCISVEPEALTKEQSHMELKTITDIALISTKTSVTYLLQEVFHCGTTQYS